MSSKQTRNPIFIDVFGFGTSLGKTTMAERLRAFFTDATIPVTLIRFESKETAYAVRDGDVLIATEQLAEAQKIHGGISGILRPVTALVDKVATDNGVIILDWPGSLRDQHIRFLVGARLDQGLARAGFDRFAFILTTSNPVKIAEAVTALDDYRTAAAGFQQVVVLNQRDGVFVYPEKTAAAASLRSLLAPGEHKTTINIPAIESDALGYFAPLRRSVREILDADADEMAAAMGEDPWITSTAQVQLAAWYELTHEELRRVFPFREKRSPREKAAADASAG